MGRRPLDVFRRVILVGLIVLSAGACAPTQEESLPAASPTPEPTASPTLEPTATPGEGPVECKDLVLEGSTAGYCYQTVPEDRSQPGSRTIRLLVAVIPSSSDSPEPDPMVFLSGGPGAAAVGHLDHFRGILRGVLQERDLVVFDQRGVGFSEPALDCPEYEEAAHDTYGADVDPEERRQRLSEALMACRDRLTAEGVNLSAYTSAASAADVHDLMEALGYDHYNLYGGSYGARLALTIMRDYADEVRSAVLDSVGPPQEDIFELRAAGFERALERLFEQCAASETCHEQYPNLPETFYALLDKLEEEPVAVSATGQTYQVGADELVELVLMAMYDPSGISALPGAIYGTWEGQTSWLATPVATVLSMPRFLWEGMHFAVWCAEEVPFNSADDAAEINADIHPAIVRGLQADNLPWMVELCEMWGAAAAGAIEDQPVQVDVPALILTGEFDPVTPPEFASSTAEHLEKAQSYFFPGLTHDVLSSSACAQEMVRQFVHAPEEIPDTSCLEES